MPLRTGESLVTSHSGPVAGGWKVELYCTKRPQEGFEGTVVHVLIMHTADMRWSGVQVYVFFV
jgi:hypothetical protein